MRLSWAPVTLAACWGAVIRCHYVFVKALCSPVHLYLQWDWELELALSLFTLASHLSLLHVLQHTPCFSVRALLITAGTDESRHVSKAQELWLNTKWIVWEPPQHIRKAAPSTFALKWRKYISWHTASISVLLQIITGTYDQYITSISAGNHSNDVLKLLFVAVHTMTALLFLFCWQSRPSCSLPMRCLVSRACRPCLSTGVIANVSKNILCLKMARQS